MSFFSSPPSKPAQPEPQEDEATAAARRAQEQRLNADRSELAMRERQRMASRTMGNPGANSTYSDTAAGFPRTLGSANV